MRRVVVQALVVVALVSVPAIPVSADREGPLQQQVLIDLDKTSVEVGVGQGFQFSSTIANTGNQPLTSLVAHLNVVSADGSTYVDPEDWSSDRSQYLDTLAPDATWAPSWDVKAVNSGALILYVAVTTASGADEVVASGPLRATVTQLRTIDATGVLPVALAVPAAFVVCFVMARRRRRQLL